MMWTVIAGLGIALITTWALTGVERQAGRLFVEGWRLVVAELAVAAGILFALGPNLRRFGKGLLDEVFRLNPETGARFVSVLDLAYYIAFAGLMLVDADVWDLSAALPLTEALSDGASRLALFLLAMGVLHTINIVVLPFIGIVFNSLQRQAIRREAGVAAPPESPRARRVDQHAKTIVIVVLVLAVALILVQVLPAIIFGLA